MKRTKFRTVLFLAFCALAGLPGLTLAQGVTTAEMTGIVRDAQGAVVPGVTVTAVHQPSGTSYETVSQADGRFFIPGMRIGGPYSVTAALTGFRTEEKSNINLSLGVAQDLNFALQLANIAETITVVGVSSPIFGSNRTGAATAVSRDDLATLPTLSGRINDVTRLSPQYGGSGSFSGQDGRYNNITVQQQLRPSARRPAGRPHERRADFARSHRTDSGVGSPLRCPPGQLRRRQREHRDSQRHQQVHRIGLHAHAQRRMGG
jgi:hypothetical protein